MTTKVAIMLMAVTLAQAGNRTVAPAAADTWVNATGNLAHKLSECGTVTLLADVPDSDVVIAGVAGRGLWANTGGLVWSQLGDGSGSDTIGNRPSSIVFDPMDPSVFWESGIYNGAGIFKTVDGGRTFHQLGDIKHNDSVSVDLGDPARRTLAAGGHEQGRIVYLSSDGGSTWTNVGTDVPGGTSYPLVITGNILLVNASTPADQPGGIYRSRNGGLSWQRVSTVQPSGAPLWASDRTIYWAAGEGLVRSDDYGTTWTMVGNGLQGGVPPIELPDGRLAAVGQQTVVVSADRGVTWAPIGETLPFKPQGLIYSPRQQAFYIWRGACTDEVARDAIMRLDISL